ncbi:aldehyde ferredoxin oxidoreductase, partial [Candidatus Geothermarchaeota archaeon]
MVGGYMGKLIRVDLWSGRIRIEDLPPENILKSWIGGRGLGVYLALKEINPKIDPLSPSNKSFI